MGTAVTPTAAGASPDAQQPAAMAPQQPANGSEEPAPSSGRRQGSKRAAAVVAAAQISAQQQPRPPSRGSGALAAVQTGAARQQQSNGDGEMLHCLAPVPALATIRLLNADNQDSDTVAARCCAHMSAWLWSPHALGASAGTTPTTPRRMRALHEIPSLETQAHLGRRPSVPPDDEVCDVTSQSCAIQELTC